MATLFRALRPQIVIALLSLLLEFLAHLGVIPPPSELSSMLLGLIERHGIIVVGISSFCENFAGLGTYFPGSVVLLAAMTLTAGKPQQAIATYFAVLLPAIVSNIASFGVGNIARIRRTHQNADARTRRGLVTWYVATYWHPQLAGLTAMASAAEGVPFKRYLSFFLPISIAWSVSWAMLLYHVGGILNIPNNLGKFFYFYLAGWTGWDTWQWFKKQKRERERDL